MGIRANDGEWGMGTGNQLEAQAKKCWSSTLAGRQLQKTLSRLHVHLQNDQQVVSHIGISHAGITATTDAIAVFVFTWMPCRLQLKLSIVSEKQEFDMIRSCRFDKLMSESLFLF